MLGLNVTAIWHLSNLELAKNGPRGPRTPYKIRPSESFRKGFRINPLPLRKVVASVRPFLPATAPADCGEFDVLLLLFLVKFAAV